MNNINNLTIGLDATFELNEFSQPRLTTQLELAKNILLFILFSRPGEIPSLPNIGLDIESMLYSHYDDIDPNNLKIQILDQCAGLTSFFNDNMIIIRKIIYRNQPSLLIDVQMDQEYSARTHNMINSFLIGLTFDELGDMIVNVQGQGGII